MKTSTGTLIVLGAALLAGSALAQSATLNSSGATVAVETRAAPNGGPSAAPGSTGGERLRLINNSETDTAEVEGSYRAVSGETPVNGIGGLGGGRYSQEAATVTGRVTNAQGQPETARAQSSGGPVNGIGGVGGGRYTFRLGRMINNSETDPGAAVSGAAPGEETPVNGIGGTGGGRFTFVPTSRLNTVEACTARRGVAVMHEGIQQCRLPATAPARTGG